MRVGVLALVLLALVGTAHAELQNVEVGGQIEIRSRWYHNAFTEGVVPMRPAPVVRIPASWTPLRPMGTGPLGVTSVFSYDHRDPDWAFTEQATSLYVKADFTDDVNALIEFYDFNAWGRRFPSDYITGTDTAGPASRGVEVLNGYIEINSLFDQPLRLRVGRQPLKFGKGWLVTDKTTPTQRISFDGFLLTYEQNDITVDAFMTKLAENSPTEQDGDVDFYGVYGTYKACDAASISAYYFLIRDAVSLNDTFNPLAGEWIEDLFGYDDYDPSYLNTIGTRIFGKTGGWDYDLELAYQFGNADSIGVMFKERGYGDDSAEWDNWGTDFEAGYTFDCKWSPRVFAAATYFEGEDNRSLSFAEWLNPFDRADASVNFNRLFSDKNYCPTLNDNGDLSNFSNIRAGVQVKPTDKISLLLRAGGNWVDEPFSWPAHVAIGRVRIPIAPALSFWDVESDDYLGITTCTVLTYKYSEDLTIIGYYGHLFNAGATEQGNFIHGNGLNFDGGLMADDADYFFLWSILKF